LAKKKRTYKKRAYKKKNNFQSYLSLFILIIAFLGAYVFNEEIRFIYLKARSVYTVYHQKYISKTEADKIKKIISKYENQVFGLDISHYQGIVNWNKVQFLEDSTKVSFVILRATMGENSSDKYFTYNWRESKTKNIIRGAYHYYRPDENSEEQAKKFIKKVKLEKGDLPPVLDIEELSTTQNVKSLRKGIQNWLDLVEKEYKVKPILYTGDSFFRANIKGQGFDDYPLWIANYNKKRNKPIAKDWIIWQFSDKGKATGIGEFVDLNVFDGKEKVFKYLLLE